MHSEDMMVEQAEDPSSVSFHISKLFIYHKSCW